jgi:hypothetical protein
MLAEPSERETYRAELRRHVAAIFRRVKIEFGENEARRLFGNYAARRRGHPAGSRNPNRDAELLAFYGQRARQCSDRKQLAALPRQLAVELEASSRGRYGAGARAIEKHIRRLLDLSRRRGHASARNLRLVAKLLGGPDPAVSRSFLSEAGKDSK